MCYYFIRSKFITLLYKKKLLVKFFCLYIFSLPFVATFSELGYDDCVKVHVLPREMLGRSTFGLSMWMLKWLPIRLVDRFLLILSWLILGNTAQFGLHRPPLGPLELKNSSGKTPVLDIGTLAKIKSGDIKVTFT